MHALMHELPLLCLLLLIWRQWLCACAALSCRLDLLGLDPFDDVLLIGP